MSLNELIKELRIPYGVEDVTSPKGLGAKIFSNLAKEKIGNVIKREKDVTSKVGILVSDPTSSRTQHPIAIVCEFEHSISNDILSFTHKLCWNFCRSPLLIVIEPTIVRTFSCYESPTFFGNPNSLFADENREEFDPPRYIFKFETINKALSVESKSAIEALQWVELVSGNFFEKQRERFPLKERADKTLLDNLSSIRKKLKEKGLDYDTIHDLLARLIFVQFLFQRKDSKGNAAVSSEYLEYLHTQKLLSIKYENFEQILRNFHDAYKFFRLLNERFNGDLFPGDREENWQIETSKVTEEHLGLLADFVCGKIEVETRQIAFWEMYSFDTIPLEFISSIYEEFVSSTQSYTEVSKINTENLDKGVHYTKSHLVDFLLDSVLPWDETEWDLQVLDPSCGSGIFLVKVFQRLVQRWKNYDEQIRQKRNKYKIIPRPDPEFLSKLLENNLFGIDINPHAVRVASFSLYLAMCDEIDPRNLWQKTRFPNLREKQIVARDFFEEDDTFFGERKEDTKYDLIIGNAPWGKDTLKTSEYARKWGKKHGWETSYSNIGPLFLPKAASLAKANARISLIQPALPILTGSSGKAEKFRKRLFKEFKIEEITNLSDLRFVLFEKAISPPCVVTMLPSKPDGDPILYVCPKKRGTDEDYRHIVIEPMDINWVSQNDAIDTPWVWTTLMWGSVKDVELLKRLQEYNNISKLKKTRKALIRQGIIRGNRKKDEPFLINKRILDDSEFPSDIFLLMDATSLPINMDSKVDGKASSDFESFIGPQMFIKQTWKTSTQRFSAALINAIANEGVLCSRAYLNVHCENLRFLKSATITFNSRFSTYYLLLTDGRFSFYRPEPSVDSFWKVPIPEITEQEFETLENIEKKSKVEALTQLDDIVIRALQLSKSDEIIINDSFDFTLKDFKGGGASVGRQSTKRGQEPDLTEFSKTFIEVMTGAFGKDKKICATIFQEAKSNYLPLRMVAIHLEMPNREKLIKIDKCENQYFWSLLDNLNSEFMEIRDGNIFHKRVIKLYRNVNNIPTVYLVKPDQKRYWLKSQALLDADEVFKDIMFSKNAERNSEFLGEREERIA